MDLDNKIQELTEQRDALQAELETAKNEKETSEKQLSDLLVGDLFERIETGEAEGEEIYNKKEELKEFLKYNFQAEEKVEEHEFIISLLKRIDEALETIQEKAKNSYFEEKEDEIVWEE